MAILEIKNLSVLSGGKEIVHDVSLSVRQGEVHVIMGPNGSGKSTLANAVFGHPKYAVSGGNVFFDGEDITFLPTDKKAKRGLFLSMQHLPEIDGVTLEKFLHRAHRELSGQNLSPVEFHEYLSAKAGAYGLPEDFLRRNVNAGLSGGEKKQNEAFQLAFFEPKFAFLDELDSGVDVDSLERIWDVIRALREKGTAFILITHYGKILEKISPDFVHVMKDGRVVRSGGPELAEEIAEKGFKEFE